MKASPHQLRAPRAIFWTAFGLRVLCIVIGHTYRVRPLMDHFQFGWEMGRIARSLVLGQGYANPFNGPSGPTAWTPPLYPLLMALSFKLFGIYTNAAALFLLVCNSLFSALIAPAVYELAARCFDAYGIARRASRRAEPVALWAGWMWAVYPAALQYAIHWLWEMSLSTCLFTWTLVLALRLRGVGERGVVTMDSDLHAGGWSEPAWLPQGEGAGRRYWMRWAGFGVLWGLLALSNASLLLCLPAVMLWVGWPELRGLTVQPRAVLRPLGGAVLAVVLVAALVTPWAVRNERVMHAFIPTRSNFGIELYNSAMPSHDGLPWGTAMPVWAGDPEFKRYVALGEVEYARVRGEEARALMRTEPGQIWRWRLDRFLYFWDGTPHPPENHPAAEYLRNLSYAFLSVCGVLGLLVALWRKVPGAGLLALVFVLMPLPYYALTVQARFRHPIEPLIAVLGVYLFRATDQRPLFGWRGRAAGQAAGQGRVSA